jgi:hypothetical protein
MPSHDIYGRSFVPEYEVVRRSSRRRANQYVLISLQTPSLSPSLFSCIAEKVSVKVSSGPDQSSNLSNTMSPPPSSQFIAQTGTAPTGSAQVSAVESIAASSHAAPTGISGEETEETSPEIDYDYDSEDPAFHSDEERETDQQKKEREVRPLDLAILSDEPPYLERLNRS